MKEVQELLAAHNQFKVTMPNADSEFKNILQIEQVKWIFYYLYRNYLSIYLECLIFEQILDLMPNVF